MGLEGEEQSKHEGLESAEQAMARLTLKVALAGKTKARVSGIGGPDGSAPWDRSMGLMGMGLLPCVGIHGSEIRGVEWEWHGLS